MKMPIITTSKELLNMKLEDCDKTSPKKNKAKTKSKFTARGNKRTNAQVACPKCGYMMHTYDLYIKDKLVGIGCEECFKHLPVIKKKT